MLKRGKGSIINISSVAGLGGMRGVPTAYQTTKGAVATLTQSLSANWADRGVRVNAIAPGFIDTEMTRVLDEEVRQKLIEQIPLARLGLPEDVARCVNFLVSDRSSYITGQVINLNGGMLM